VTDLAAIHQGVTDKANPLRDVYYRVLSQALLQSSGLFLTSAGDEGATDPGSGSQARGPGPRDRLDP
jgi:hypothetical protein